MRALSRRAFLSVAVGGAAVACASKTQYQAGGLTGGYSDKRVNEATWHVRFDGNSYSTADDVFIFWLYRAAEITLRENYTHFRVLERRADVGFGSKPWCDGTVQLLRDVPPEQRTRVYDAQWVIREHRGKTGRV